MKIHKIHFKWLEIQFIKVIEKYINAFSLENETLKNLIHYEAQKNYCYIEEKRAFSSFKNTSVKRSIVKETATRTNNNKRLLALAVANIDLR